MRELATDSLWMLMPLAILYGGLLGAAPPKWRRHRHAPHVTRCMWLLIIMVFSMMGPAACLLLAREHG